MLLPAFAIPTGTAVLGAGLETADARSLTSLLLVVRARLFGGGDVDNQPAVCSGADFSTTVRVCLRTVGVDMVVAAVARV